MTRISQWNQGKVEEHGEPVGVPSPSDVEQRARDLALINGRQEVTPQDRQDAHDELLNRKLPQALAEDADGNMQSMSRDPSDPVSNRGHQTPEYIEADEERVFERLALEGVEEAQHDQMVQARVKQAASELDAEVGAKRDGVNTSPPPAAPERRRKKE